MAVLQRGDVDLHFIVLGRLQRCEVHRDFLNTVFFSISHESKSAHATCLLKWIKNTSDQKHINICFLSDLIKTLGIYIYMYMTSTLLTLYDTYTSIKYIVI